MIRWKRKRYRSISWALPDVYALHPQASDQSVADLLNVSAQAVQQARTRAGIPEFRRRSPGNCYEIREAAS